MDFIINKALDGLKKSVLSKDANKNEIPDALEHLANVEKTLHFVGKVGSRFTALDWERILTQLNAVAGQKLSAAEIREGSAALALVGPSANALAEGLHAASVKVDPKATAKIDAKK